MNKLRVGIYKKAIKFLERELTWTSKRKTYHASGCCRYIQLAAGVEGHEGLIELPEYKLFKRMFGSGAGQDTYWFGEPNREKDGMPHKVNQRRRITALRKTIEAANKFNAEFKTLSQREKEAFMCGPLYFYS